MTRTLRALGVLAEDFEAVVARLRERSTEELKRCGLGGRLERGRSEPAADVAPRRFRGARRGAAGASCARRLISRTRSVRTRTPRSPRHERATNDCGAFARACSRRTSRSRTRRAPGQAAEIGRETKTRETRFRSGPCLGDAFPPPDPRWDAPAGASLLLRTRSRSWSSARCHAERKRVRARARRASRRVLRVPRDGRRRAGSRGGWRFPAAAAVAGGGAGRLGGPRASVDEVRAVARACAVASAGGDVANATRIRERWIRVEAVDGLALEFLRRLEAATLGAEEATPDTPPSENSSTRWKSSSGTWSAADACRWSPREAASRRKVAKADPSRRPGADDVARRGGLGVGRRRRRGRAGGAAASGSWRGPRTPTFRRRSGAAADHLRPDPGRAFRCRRVRVVAAAAGPSRCGAARSAARSGASRVRPRRRGWPSAPTASARTLVSARRRRRVRAALLSTPRGGLRGRLALVEDLDRAASAAGADRPWRRAPALVATPSTPPSTPCASQFFAPASRERATLSLCRPPWNAAVATRGGTPRARKTCVVRFPQSSHETVSDEKTPRISCLTRLLVFLRA